MSETRLCQILEENINLMNNAAGFDVVIVCTGNATQTGYWQNRLEMLRGQIISPECIILVVDEDWEDGAGNALGTFYAYQKAKNLAKSRHGIDIHDKLGRHEISIGMYHTAGKGTRLAPLPGSENNNKPGVKLGACVYANDELVPITILEAVIKQTGVYGPRRKGRLSVFWGDQVFIPSVSIDNYIPGHHIDILCKLGPMLSEEEWELRGMQKYGLIAVNAQRESAQVEKVSHATALRLLSDLGQIIAVGVSLGSFSISYLMLDTLLQVFESELSRKAGKFDADPHLWMPFTLPKHAYVEIMTSKGVLSEVASSHHDRMQTALNNFWARARSENNEQYLSFGLFGAVDVGQDSYWWDYGQLKLYYRNNMILTQKCLESDLMRKFYNLPLEKIEENCKSEGKNANDFSTIVASTFGPNSCVSNSVLCNVNCEELICDESIIVNSTVRKIRLGKGCIMYNVVNDSENGIVLNDGDVLVGVIGNDGRQILIESHINTDGGNQWKSIVKNNPHSFEDIYNMNCSIDLLRIQEHSREMHRNVRNLLN